ncbi:hypothetical protein RGU72_11590 [Undibacterium sp. 5I1]|uniref:hypothetical protein n=1 Tax=unclassified Undibacterium TaxID=2630295 RepID=UPI002AB4CBA4|nr:MULTISPECIES: hypothetical protein [unclassified Undibacterium]MDY7538900.1 hypothetical protein [Undibacterium sp. 5I1]MEB0231024.1 hypothetical protein [Undibacterium sp. 10I3]MEB0257793.1 hypothetical protein [Undibacterium sp. 5I1]
MTKRHQYLPLSKITAGRVLAADLLDKQGHVLLPAGVTLSESMLVSIAQHHVQQLSVIADDLPEVDDASVQKAKLERLDQLFRHTHGHAPTTILFDYMRAYRDVTP